MARLGIVPGEPFDFGRLDPAVQEALRDVPRASFERIMSHFEAACTDLNGWLFTTKTGIYVTDYLQLALVTAIGLGRVVPRTPSTRPPTPMLKDSSTRA